MEVVLTVVAAVIFCVTYILIAARELSFLPIGRPSQSRAPDGLHKMRNLSSLTPLRM